MAVAETTRKLTEAEYLAIEEAAESKSEFYDGEMFAMAGGSATHSLIATTLTGALMLKLKGGPCRVFNSDLRLKVEATGLLTYPDASVICGALRFAPGRDDTVTNPTVVLEVLSPSTEGYDRGEKFLHYRQMPSLQEYVLVSQRSPRIEQFIRRPEGEWALRTAEGMESSIMLPSLKIVLLLREVFAGVEFSPSPIRPPAKPSI